MAKTRECCGALSLRRTGDDLHVSLHQLTPKRLERYLEAEPGHPQSSLTIKHHNTRVFLPYMAAPSGHKFGFTHHTAGLMEVSLQSL